MKNRSYRLLAWSALGLLASLVMLPRNAHATVTTLTWLPPSGNWNVSGNWSGATLPTPTNDAVVDSSRTVLLPIGVSGTANGLFVGNSGTGTLNFSGGLLTTLNGFLGFNAGSNGTATVTTGTWNNYSLGVGYSGTGTLNIKGGNVTDANGHIGYNAGSNGTATVTSGTWTNSNTLDIGGYGAGTLNLSRNGVVTVANGAPLTLANIAGSVGTLNLGTGDTVGTLNAAVILGGNGTSIVNFNHTGTFTFAPQISVQQVNKLGSGTTIFTAISSFANSTTVSAGELDVNGSLASNTVNVHSGATLSGSGAVNGPVAVNGTLAGTLTTGPVSGSGLVSPGNSPGILTTSSVDVSSGLDFAFEFTLPGAPHYSSATASGNDILHLTSVIPFSGNLTADNTISIYLSNANAGTYLGGFFTDLIPAAALKDAIKNAKFEFFVVNVDGSVTFNGINYSTLDAALVSVDTAFVTDADFSGGIIAGSEMKITVVPEPSTWAMLMGGMGLLAFVQRYRRECVRVTCS